MKIKRFEFNMFPVNCYVLWDDTKEAVVIDPGCFYEEEKQALKKFILTNELNVKHLLNTHLHLDHIFGNPFMLKEFGLSAEANKADEYWIDEAPKQSRMFGFQLQEKPVPLGKYLHDGDSITFGHTTLEAIHVPGHSPAVWCIIVKKTTVCSPAMSCFKAVSAVPTSQAVTSTS